MGFGFKTLVIRNESALGWDSKDLRSPIDSSPVALWSGQGPSLLWTQQGDSIGIIPFFRNSL